MKKIIKMIGIGIGILILADFIVSRLAAELCYWSWYYSIRC